MVAVLMASSLLSIGYLMPVVGRAFFSAPREEEGAHGEHDGGGDDDNPGIREAPVLCVLPPVLTAVGCLVLFFFADEIYQLLSGMIGR